MGPQIRVDILKSGSSSDIGDSDPIASSSLFRISSASSLISLNTSSKSSPDLPSFISRLEAPPRPGRGGPGRPLVGHSKPSFHSPGPQSLFLSHSAPVRLLAPLPPHFLPSHSSSPSS
uniref:Uncharacterized protein n=1 Tax=Cacopsylla melanoneura TaxID=428564 RepID=A0A8D9FJD9_9HEMI